MLSDRAEALAVAWCCDGGAEEEASMPEDLVHLAETALRLSG